MLFALPAKYKELLLMNEDDERGNYTTFLEEGGIVPSSKKRLNKFSKNSLYLTGKAESIV